MGDLDATLASLEAEAEGLDSRSRTLGAAAQSYFEEIQGLRPREANLRTGYTGNIALFDEIDRLIALSVRRGSMPSSQQ